MKTTSYIRPAKCLVLLEILCVIAFGPITARGAGVTIITHGFQLGLDNGLPLLAVWPINWVDAMGLVTKQEAERCGGVASLWEYSAPEQRFILKMGNVPDAGQSNSEMILLFNWAPDSNEYGGGFAEAAGEALFVALMKGWTKADGSQACFAELPLHFIGHSRGAVVNSAAVRRLGGLGIEVDQVTTLDPHQAVGNLISVYEDYATPMGTWANVGFADNYYRCGLLFEDLDFDGMPVIGSLASEFTESSLWGGYQQEHSDVHLWYHGTIDHSLYATDGDKVVPESFYGGENPLRTESGFYYSRIKGGQRPGPGLRSSGALRVVLPVGETWMANGDFRFAPGINSQIAGYYRHGGSADISLVLDEDAGQRRFARLDSDETSLCHNAVFIPHMGGNAELRFRMRVNHLLQDDATLLVSMVEGSVKIPIRTIELIEDKDWSSISIPVET